LEDCLSVSDFTIAGCHKWLGGYFPLGVAFYGQPGTRGLVDGITTNMLEDHQLDDPVLRFCRQLAGSRLDGYSETVNLGPIFSCRGAMADAPTERGMLQNHLEQQLENARLVVDLARKSGWQAVRPAHDLRSGILLLEPQGPSQPAGDAVRQRFLRADVAITAYDDGLARLAMPKQALSSSELRQIRHALEGDDSTDNLNVRDAHTKLTFPAPIRNRISADTPIGWSNR
jgi:hypothetical protein